MAATSSVTFDDKAVRKDMKRLAKEFPREAKQTLTRTAKRTATRARRTIAGQLGVPIRVLRRRVGAFSTKTLRVFVWVGLKKSIGFSELSGRHLSRAIKSAASAPFVATMRNGHKGLYVRDALRSRRYRVRGPRLRADGQSTELPIIEAQIKIDSKRALAVVEQEAKEQLRLYLPTELRRRIAVAANRSKKS